MSRHTAPTPGTQHPDPARSEQLSLFQRVADRVSYGMGTPTNIAVWIVLVAGWTLLFAFGGSKIASGTWLPVWFTSTGFNFPLNLVTTVAELYIGFLVGASSNRSERNLEVTLASLGAQEQPVLDPGATTVRSPSSASASTWTTTCVASAATHASQTRTSASARSIGWVRCSPASSGWSGDGMRRSCVAMRCAAASTAASTIAPSSAGRTGPP
jgi:hypothetical protein